MLDRDDHELLVSRLYASALGELSWADTLSFGAGLFRSEAAVFRISGPDGRALAAENTRYDPEFALGYYSSEIYANDPRSAHLERSAPGAVYYDSLLYDVEEINRDPWCKAACDLLEVKYQLGLTLSLPNGCSGHLAFLTNDAQGHASDEAIAAFSRIAPHIEQAGALGHVIEMGGATRAAMLEALSAKADGIVLLGRAAQPVFMNGEAEAILRAGDGLAWSRGGFTTGRPPETRRLRALVAGALSDPDRPGGRLLISRTSGRHPYVVSVMAAPPTERFLASGAIACVIHIHDLAAVRLPSPEWLKSVFGLTDREAELAVELVRCAALAPAAAGAGMAVNTARNHLQAIFRKTGTANQAEAVQLLGRLP